MRALRGSGPPRAPPGRTRPRPAREPPDNLRGPSAPGRGSLRWRGVRRAGRRGRRYCPAPPLRTPGPAGRASSRAARVCLGSNSSLWEARSPTFRASRSYSGRSFRGSTATPSDRAVCPARSAAWISSSAARSLSSSASSAALYVIHGPLGLVEVLYGPSEEVAPAPHQLPRPERIGGKNGGRLVELLGEAGGIGVRDPRLDPLLCLLVQ